MNDIYLVTKEKLTVTTNHKDFVGVIDEMAGGIEAYVHKGFVEEFTLWLVWEKPTMGTHIDSIDHDEWDGWAVRGWDLDINTMKENLKLPTSTKTNLLPLKINGFLVGYALSHDSQSKYTALLNEFIADERTGDFGWLES